MILPVSGELTAIPEPRPDIRCCRKHRIGAFFGKISADITDGIALNSAFAFILYIESDFYKVSRTTPIIYSRHLKGRDLMEPQTKGQKARALFESGYNCAQAVAAAFAEEMELPLDTVLLLSGPFGGGMGRMREVCGTVSGMLFVLGKLDGYLPEGDKLAHAQEKKRVYQAVQELAAKFREKNGSIVCRELLAGIEKDSSATPSERTPQYYQKRPCAHYVEEAADLIAAYLAARKQA